MPISSTDRTNEDWLAELNSGNAQAISDLRVYLCNRLEFVLAGKAGQSDFEDFAQDALRVILDSLEKFRGESRFTTWAAAIAVRQAYSELRKKKWGSVSLDALTSQNGPLQLAESEVFGGSLKADQQELLTALEEGIENALTARQRAIVIAELHKMPMAALSVELGVSRGAIYKAHFDARKKLRTYLEGKGFNIDDLRELLNAKDTR